MSDLDINSRGGSTMADGTLTPGRHGRAQGASRRVRWTDARRDWLVEILAYPLCAPLVPVAGEPHGYFDGWRNDACVPHTTPARASAATSAWSPETPRSRATQKRTVPSACSKVHAGTCATKASSNSTPSSRGTRRTCPKTGLLPRAQRHRLPPTAPRHVAEAWADQARRRDATAP